MFKKLAWPPISYEQALVVAVLAVAGPLLAWFAYFWPVNEQPLYLAGRDILIIGLLLLRWRKAWEPRLAVWVLPFLLWLLISAYQGQGSLIARIAGLRQWLMPFGMIALGMAWMPRQKTNESKDLNNHRLSNQPIRYLVWFLLTGTLILYLLTALGQLAWCRTYFEAKQMPFVEGIPQQWLEPIAGGIYRAAGWWLDPVSNGHTWVWALAVLLALPQRHTLLIAGSLLALLLTTSKGAWLQAFLVAGLGGLLALAQSAEQNRVPAWLQKSLILLILAIPLLLPWPVRLMADLHPGIAIHWHGWSSAMQNIHWAGDGLGSHGNVALLMHNMKGETLHSTTVVDSAWGSLLAQTGVVGLMLWLGTWIALAIQVGKSYPLLGLLAYVQIVISMFSENAINPMAMLPLCLSLGSAFQSGSLRPSMNPPRSTLLDYVGRKAGMDYFSLRLHDSLKKSGVHNTLYSNFSKSDDPSIVQAFAFESGSTKGFIAQINYLKGILRTFVGMIQNRSDYFLFHFFKAGPRELLVLLGARLLGQKIHLLVHDVESLDTTQRGSTLGWIRSLILDHWSDRVYAFSRTSANEILRGFPRIKDRLTVLRHGHFLDLPTQTPSPEDARSERGLEKGLFYLLFFGQIKASKGLDILLEAMNLVQDPEVHLVIAGSARDVDPQDLIQSLVDPSVQTRVHLHQRYINDQERDAWFKACDALVIPYRRIYNSGVLMMGLSYGKTVIASDLPANREIIQNGVNGCLFEDGNPLDLAQNIIRLKNTSNRPTFEAIMNPLRADHSWDIMAQQIKPFLRR